MLAIWEYFWDETEWTGSPPAPTPAPSPAPSTVVPGSGGGHAPYTPADDEYWNLRATYLEYLNPSKKRISPAPPPQTPAPAPTPRSAPLTIAHLPRLTAERTIAVETANAARTAQELSARFERLKQLDATIKKLRRQRRNARIRSATRAFLKKLLRKALLVELRRTLNRMDF